MMALTNITLEHDYSKALPLGTMQPGHQPMTMATMPPIEWIPCIQRKEPLTDALVDIRTAGFS